MKFFWTGWYRGLCTNKNKSHGYILLPEVLIAMLVVAFCMSQLWQTVLGAMNFGAKIEKEFLLNNDFSKICTRIFSSPSAISILFEQKQQLSIPVDDNKKNDSVVLIEFSNKKSELAKIAGSRFAYLCLKNNSNQTLKLPIFLGPEDKDSKKDSLVKAEKAKDADQNAGGK